MRQIWVLHAAYRGLYAQLRELEQLSAPTLPREIWVLGGEKTFLPQNENGIPYRLLQTSSSNPEVWLSLLVQACGEFSPDLLVFGSSEAAESVAARLAYRLGGRSLSGCCAIDWDAEENLLLQKKVYSGHMLATLRLTARPFCIAAEKCPDNVQPAEFTEGAPCLVWQGDATGTAPEPELVPLERPKGLATATRLVAVGMGIKSPEKLQQAGSLAAQVGAALGASRPVAMNGWLPMEQLLGVSGEIAAPKLCLLLGASGAPAFWSGIERSNYIIAVNNDPNAPCLRWADLGVVTDCGAFIDALEKLVTVQERAAQS